MVMHTAEPVDNTEDTDMLVKILDSTYAEADLEQVTANKNQIKYDDRNKLISLHQYFDDIFDGTIGDWYIDPVDLELKPYSKPFNCKYYMVSRINKETFRKYLKWLVWIGVLTLVKKSQYGTPYLLSLWNKWLWVS